MSEKIFSIIISVIILIYLLYNLLSQPQNNTRQNILIWLGIFFCLIILYAFRFELINLKDRIFAVLVPNYSWSEQEGNLAIARHGDGHFYLYGKSSNDIDVKFLVDTGATNVALTKEDAIKLGINVENLQYNIRYNTANGVNFGAPVRIAQMQIGKKILYDVRAHIMRSGLDASLLGMSAIDQFKDFQISRDLLILSY